MRNTARPEASVRTSPGDTETTLPASIEPEALKSSSSEASSWPLALKKWMGGYAGGFSAEANPEPDAAAPWQYLG